MDRHRRAFAEKMIATLRGMGYDGPLAFDEHHFALRAAGSGTIYLDNAYDDWRQAPRRRRGKVLKHYASGALRLDDALPASLDEARPRIRVRVRDLDWYGITALLSGGEGALAASFAPLNDDLALEVVYDLPTAVSSIGPDVLEGWGIELEDAIRIGRGNLRDASLDGFERVNRGVYLSPWQDTYDASRLILTEVIARLELRGDPVALLPTRDHLLLAGSDDVPALGSIARLARPLLDDRRRLTGYAFIWLDGSWQRYLPPSGHPLRPDYEQLARLTAVRAYDDQLGLLRERVGGDLYVGEISLVRPPRSAARVSVATWPEGPTLLPRTDFVAVVHGGRDARFVPWESLVATWGDEMEPQGLRPERWRVEHHPPRDLVERIASQTLKT